MTILGLSEVSHVYNATSFNSSVSFLPLGHYGMYAHQHDETNCFLENSSELKYRYTWMKSCKGNPEDLITAHNWTVAEDNPSYWERGKAAILKMIHCEAPSSKRHSYVITEESSESSKSACSRLEKHVVQTHAVKAFEGNLHTSSVYNRVRAIFCTPTPECTEDAIFNGECSTVECYPMGTLNDVNHLTPSLEKQINETILGTCVFIPPKDSSVTVGYFKYFSHAIFGYIPNNLGKVCIDLYNAYKKDSTIS